MTLRIDPLAGPKTSMTSCAIEQASFANPWTRDMYLAELEHRGTSYCYIAREDEGVAVGFCSFWRILDELHINNLAVVPEQRRSGVATALLHFVMHEGARLGARGRRSKCGDRTRSRAGCTSSSGLRSPA